MCRRVVQMIKSSGFSSCRMGVHHINTPATSHWGTHTHVHMLSGCLSAASIPYELSMNHWTTHTHSLTEVLTFFPHPLSILLFPLSSVVWKAAGFPPQTCTWTTPFSSFGVHQSTRCPSIRTHPYWSTWYGPVGGIECNIKYWLQSYSMIWASCSVCNLVTIYL